MITKVYACDKCRKAKEQKELTTIKFTIQIPDGFSKNNYSRTIYGEERHLCKDCLNEKGLFVESEENSTKTQSDSKANFEDHFYDWLVSLGVQFEE